VKIKDKQKGLGPLRVNGHVHCSSNTQMFYTISKELLKSTTVNFQHNLELKEDFYFISNIGKKMQLCMILLKPGSTGK